MTINSNYTDFILKELFIDNIISHTKDQDKETFEKR